MLFNSNRPGEITPDHFRHHNSETAEDERMHFPPQIQDGVLNTGNDLAFTVFYWHRDISCMNKVPPIFSRWSTSVNTGTIRHCLITEVDIEATKQEAVIYRFTWQVSEKFQQLFSRFRRQPVQSRPVASNSDVYDAPFYCNYKCNDCETEISRFGTGRGEIPSTPWRFQWRQNLSFRRTVIPEIQICWLSNRKCFCPYRFWGR